MVGVVQPMGTTDLLAGFIPEDRVLAGPQALAAFNEDLMRVLKTQTHRSYVFIPKAAGVIPRSRNRAVSRTGRRSARKRGWTCSIVPQILDWRERAGSGAGVTTSAALEHGFLPHRRARARRCARGAFPFQGKQVGLATT